MAFLSRCAGALVLLALAFCASAAEPAGGTYRLLVLDSQLGNPYDEVRAALRQRLAEHGYREGENLEVKLLSASNDVDSGVGALNRALTRRYDAVFVGGTVATIAAKQVLYGKTIPVVFGSPTDPVGIGVIDDFASAPKANFTGVCYPVPVEARLRFVRQLMPEAKTFGLIYADMPQSHSYNRWIREQLAQNPEFRDIEVIFRAVPLVTGEFGDRQMAEQAIPLIRELDGQVDAFLKPNDQLGTRRLFAQTVATHASKPLIGIVKGDVMSGWGATAVVYPSHESIGRQAADMLARIFRGTAIGSIRPEWPRTYGYAIDLARIKQFGIRVPVGILQLAGDNIVH